MRNANKIKVVGWVALRPNPPAFSGRPQRALRGATARSAIRPTFLMRLLWRWKRELGLRRASRSSREDFLIRHGVVTAA